MMFQNQQQQQMTMGLPPLADITNAKVTGGKGAMFTAQQQISVAPLDASSCSPHYMGRQSTESSNMGGGYSTVISPEQYSPMSTMEADEAIPASPEFTTTTAAVEGSADATTYQHEPYNWNCFPEGVEVTFSTTHQQFDDEEVAENLDEEPQQQQQVMMPTVTAAAPQQQHANSQAVLMAQRLQMAQHQIQFQARLAAVAAAHATGSGSNTPSPAATISCPQQQIMFPNAPTIQLPHLQQQPTASTTGLRPIVGSTLLSGGGASSPTAAIQLNTNINTTHSNRRPSAPQNHHADNKSFGNNNNAANADEDLAPPVPEEPVVCRALVQFKCHQAEFSSHLLVEPGQYVVVQADRGIDIGAVSRVNTEDHKAYIERTGPSAAVLRYATQREVDYWASDLKADEATALEFCRQRVQRLALPMEVRHAEYQFDKKKLTFYYDAKARVDFVTMLKELYREYGCRIWMEKVRQHE